MQGIYNDFDMREIEADHANMREELRKSQERNVA